MNDSTDPLVIHGFRSPDSVVAYCGAVVRPDSDRPRIESRSHDIPDGACPECVSVYLSMVG